MKYDVFISYSRKDTEVANRICEAFDKEGITYFIDRQGIGGAYEFPTVLAEAIISSKIFLYLASRNSYKSKYTQSEITFAFNRKDKCAILPYIIDGSSMPISLEFVFSAINWRNMQEHPIETVLVDDLLHLLGRTRKSHCDAEQEKVAMREKQPVSVLSKKNRLKAAVKWLLPTVFVLALLSGVYTSLRGSRKIGGHNAFIDTLEVVGDTIKMALYNEEVNTTATLDSIIECPVDDKNLLIDANGVCFVMKYVNPGEFMMGATQGQQNAYADEKPAHRIILDKGFYIGETEVCQSLWEAVMGKNPSAFKSELFPVERISYTDCLEFIARLNNITGHVFRLPTEAEWEFAARGGGNDSNSLYCGSDTLNKVAWYTANSGGHTHHVKEKRPNGLGIYDMTGNVWEWCSDWYGPYDSHETTNPKGLASGSYRVYRGGCWCCDAGFSRLTIRGYDTPSYRSSEVGMRLAMDR